MSRLHDMKKGLVQKATKKALHGMMNLPGFNLQKMLEKEDPKKVRGFLSDIVADTSFPESVRSGCQKILDAMDEGKSVDGIAEGEIKKQLENLKETNHEQIR